MSKPLKPKRGTTAKNDAYIGEAYEVTLDTEKHTLRVHDGVTPGGHEMASGAALDDLSEEFNTNVGTIREDTVAAAQLAASMSQGETGSLTLEGVAAEVERKAALDLSNLNAAGRSLAAGLGMPGDRHDVLALGSSGAQYTAPANGFFWLQKVSTATNQQIALFNLSRVNFTVVGTRAISAASGNTLHVFVPARKGDVVSCAYNAGGESVFYFTYAEGEEA